MSRSARSSGAGRGRRDRTCPAGRITVCDANPSMLEIGRDRAIDRGLLTGFDWTCGNAEALPFADHSFDAATIAFGIRNVTRTDRALAEAYRVLKPGGRFLCLEFGRTVLPGLDRLYDLYSFSVLPRLGRIVTGDGEAYRYLVESIRRFPDQDAFAAMIEAAGFAQVRYVNLTGRHRRDSRRLADMRLARISRTCHGLRGAVRPTGQESRAARCGASGKRLDAACRPDSAALRVVPRRPPAASRASTVFPIRSSARSWRGGRLDATQAVTGLRNTG